VNLTRKVKNLLRGYVSLRILCFLYITWLWLYIKFVSIWYRRLCCAAREESGNGTCYKREDVKLGDSAGIGSIVKFEKQKHKVSFLGFIVL
jgi:hypothetical protein